MEVKSLKTKVLRKCSMSIKENLRGSLGFWKRVFLDVDIPEDSNNIDFNNPEMKEFKDSLERIEQMNSKMKSSNNSGKGGKGNSGRDNIVEKVQTDSVQALKDAAVKVQSERSEEEIQK